MSQTVIPLKVVLLWHMHQPYYQDAVTKQYTLPWTYLHAIKDYTDMAAHLENNPKACAVINFVPVLLEQLDDYSHQIQKFLKQHKPIADPLLSALGSKHLPEGIEAKLEIIQSCLKANQKYLIDPYPAYKDLVEVARQIQKNPEAIRYLTPQFFYDLLMWYHLVWLGAFVRDNHAQIKHFLNKARYFTLADRHALLRIIAELIQSIIPRYRKLAEKGQVELSFTPYAHPIMPLLIDFKTAKEAWPDSSLPQTTAYPQGNERALWHIEEGVRVFQKYFGIKPSGVWPAEGAICDKTLDFFAKKGFLWTATGEQVLRNSLNHKDNQGLMDNVRWLHRPYSWKDSNLHCFFRDEGLSDSIGFRYGDMPAEQAVNDFLFHLGNITQHHQNHSDAVLSIILDGENAWEYYPNNGYEFLSKLYQGLANDPRFDLTTYKKIAEQKLTLPALKKVVAGSWVYGSLSTWMGMKDKDYAWDLLCQAKEFYNQWIVKARGKQKDCLQKQLAICEGSDWFWWFGDYNPQESVESFDKLYRRHLISLYQCIGQTPPKELEKPLSQGAAYSSMATGGVMRSGKG